MFGSRPKLNEDLGEEAGCPSRELTGPVPSPVPEAGLLQVLDRRGPEPAGVVPSDAGASYV